MWSIGYRDANGEQCYANIPQPLHEDEFKVALVRLLARIAQALEEANRLEDAHPSRS